MTKPNSTYFIKQVLMICFFFMVFASSTWAFNSGSTGIDGAFSPNINTTVQLPPDGILNYTTLNIPAGVTVKFQSNTENTPVYILVQGDAYIDGVIDINGISGDVLTSPPPGGYAGGYAFFSNTTPASSNGRGPGGGRGQFAFSSDGGSGSYAQVKSGGGIYGSSTLQPLLGGSGGGARPSVSGASGAGAILLASSGTLSLNGSILAVGGDGIEDSVAHSGAGSGGAVRLVASQLVGSGSIDVNGGLNHSTGTTIKGSYGRIRLEANLMNFTGILSPNLVATSLPQPVFLAALPSVRITSVDGLSAPINPDGENDVVLPSAGYPKTVTVQLAATGVPLGSTIDVTLNASTTAITSTPLVGSVANSTATAQVYLQTGISRLFASVSFQ